MKTRARTFIAALTAMATMAGLASCAHSQPEPGYPICTENEIVTYEPTDTTKTVITIGRYTIFNSEPLQKALSERIPEASFAFVDAPGTNDAWGRANTRTICPRKGSRAATTFRRLKS